MKTEKYCLILVVFAGILCVPVLGEVEQPPLPEDEPILIGQPNPALAGIEKLHVFIVQPDAEPNKDGLVWKELDAKIKRKIKEVGIKVVPIIYRGYPVREFDIPELRVNIDMLKLEDSQQYVFRIETSLATKVFFAKDSSRFLKADVWKAEPTMQAASVQSMPAAVTNAVLEQVEAFIHAYLAANPPNKRPFDANDISIVLKEPLKPAAKSTPAEYKYVASKNSKVFHKPQCSSAKRIKSENLIGYSNRDEAINAGKRPCRRCNP